MCSIQDEVAGGVLLTVADSMGQFVWQAEGAGFLQNAAEDPCSLAPYEVHLESISVIQRQRVDTDSTSREQQIALSY